MRGSKRGVSCAYIFSTMVQSKELPAKLQNNSSAPPCPDARNSLPGHFYGRKKTDPVLDAWGSYLDAREWQLWTTLTTGRELTLPGARRSINKLAGYLKMNHYPAEIFWAAEPFDLKEGYHLHSLLRFTDLAVGDDNKNAYGHLVSGWRQITGDKTARIYSERYKPDKGAHYYLAKYMNKNRSDYDLINPHIDNKDDQFEDPGIYQATFAERDKARQVERSKDNWRRATVAALHEKGIFAGKAAPEKEVYNDSRTTYDQWEAKEYKKDQPAYMGRKVLLPTGKHIFVPRFTISLK